MEKLKTIIRDNKMSTRPEFYSGRGATMSDLTGEILEGIFKGILKEFGQSAADNYVKMVADIKVASATTFLTELYGLFYSDWTHKKKKQNAPSIAVAKDEDGNYDVTHGMISMFSMMSNTRDDTDRIKNHFLKTHGVTVKGMFQDEHGTVVYYN